jgi:hypothetical protein
MSRKPKIQKPGVEPSNSAASGQRDRVPENQSSGVTEKLSDGETDDTDDTHEKRLSARVATLNEAVDISLTEEATGDPLFMFARALKAMEITTGVKLKRADLENAFSLWWANSQPGETDGPCFDEERLLFLQAFSNARTPWGANPLAEAMRLASSMPEPPEAQRYATSPKLRRLVSVCHHLQVVARDAPFFLSVRSAAKVLDIQSPDLANAFLHGLVNDGILSLVTLGTRAGRRATRYRFNHAQSPQL